MEENLSREEYEWYQLDEETAWRVFGPKTFEIINLMDGKRNLLEIRHIVSCEFGETDIEFVLHFVEDLKKLGLIAFD